MTEIRHFAGWLRSFAGLVAVAAAVALSACGGGSGAPNNTLQRPLEVAPTSVVAYSGVPTFVYITQGVGPFRAISSNPAVLPVQQNVIGPAVLLLANPVTDTGDTPVTITIDDLAPSAAADPALTRRTVSVTVRAGSLVNGFTITPNLADCGTAVCSGQTATATVTLTAPGGGPAAGHAVRFDVIGSAYAIVTNNPANPLTNSLTVVSDANGKASVVIRVNTNAPSQVAQMSVTDLTTGQQLTGNFTITQVTDGSQILSVVPDTVTITGAFKGQCSSGFVTEYFIYGGTPPYRVSSTFPNSIVLQNSVVNTNGGSFRAITNGACVDPLTFTIVDATGRQTTAELHNVEGTADAPVVTDPLVISPGSFTSATCTGNTFNFVISGGKAPFNVVSGGATVTPNPVTTTPGAVAVSGLINGSGAHQVLVGDSSAPQRTTTATITCS